MASPKYRVTINGFWCHNETWDDIFEGDGKRDEIFIEVNVKVLDNAGAVKHHFDSESETMGDTNNQPNRVLVGSASNKGGIRTGDRFPVADPIRHHGLLNQTRVPPYLIWEGELVPGRDLVMLSPTIWEFDPSSGLIDTWLAWQVSVDAQFGQRAKEIFGKIWPIAAPVFDAVSLGIQTVGTLSGIWSPLGKAGRRPIGLRRDPNNPQGVLFNPTIIALNSESADYLSRSNLQGLGNGIVEIRYVDDPHLQGVYSIFLQVEQISAGDPPTDSLQEDWRWCNKCQGLFFGGQQAVSQCPTGGPHSPQAESGSGNYTLQYDAAGNRDLQDNWRWCDKCQGLFWGLAVESSICPAGGNHTHPDQSRSSRYALPHQVPEDPTRQSKWRWCNRCQGLYFGPGQTDSDCPAGGTHVPETESGSGNYALRHVAAPPIG